MRAIALLEAAYETDTLATGRENVRHFKARLQDSAKLVNWRISINDLSLKYPKLPAKTFFNFGYSLLVPFKKGKGMFPIQDGRETKEYFANPSDRDQIKRWIMQSAQEMIATVKPPVIIRGPLTNEKMSLQRYADVTDILSSLGYNKFYERIGPSGVYWIHSRFPLEQNELPFQSRK